nr:hypothetical protein DA06_07185 [Georgenia sp. SUBG003]
MLTRTPVSRWLEWLATTTNGRLSPSRLSRPSTDVFVTDRTTGRRTIRCATWRAARCQPAW